MSATLATRPAERLAGVEIGSGWSVTTKLEKAADSTGGHFSFGYLANHVTGKRGFVKALDFSRAFEADDVLRALEGLTKQFNFEREVLDLCSDKRLSRVVTPEFFGHYDVPGFAEPINRVWFLLFERADGDARAVLDTKADTLEWRLRTLHHTATAIQQLHGVSIAHQDVKPSNVLSFGGTVGAKLCDLGRASKQGQSGPFDQFAIAGDRTYAPPELLYGFAPPDWGPRRFGADLYSLGSLILFFFTRASMTPMLISRVAPESRPGRGAKTYAEVLPLLRQAFNQCLEAAKPAVQAEAPRAASELLMFVRELCDPDPTLRGSPHLRSTSQFSVVNYISRLDHFARSAALGRP